MVVLRRTQKLKAALPLSHQPSAQSDTALGDWYVNRFVVDRRPLLLLVSSRGLLPILLPARDVATLPARLSDVVAARLHRLGVQQQLIQAERRAMEVIVVGSTIDRSIVGIMVDFAKAVPFYVEPGSWDDSTFAFVEAELAETPCYAGRRSDEVVFPNRDVPRLLAARWSG
jgi:hypothetical protein